MTTKKPLAGSGLLTLIKPCRSMGESLGAARSRVKNRFPVGTADNGSRALLMSPSWTASRERQTHHLLSHGGFTTHVDADRVEPDAARAACPVRRRLVRVILSWGDRWSCRPELPRKE